MLERFEISARRVITEAAGEARRFKHNYIGTEHILLGLLVVEGTAFEALSSLGLTRAQVRADIRRICGLGREMPPDRQLALTPRTKKIIALAFREMLSFGDSTIGTEHLLLGLVCETEAVATRILHDRGTDSKRVRDTVLTKMRRQRREKRGRTHPNASSVAEVSPAVVAPSSAPACSECGEIMNRVGDLFICMRCGNNTATSTHQKVRAFLATWQDAASKKDEERFFEMMTDNVTVVGIGDNIWSLDTPQTDRSQLFRAAQIWNWSLDQMKVQAGCLQGNLVWFVESLESGVLGNCRNSGIVRLEDEGTWKLLFYVLSNPI